MKIEKATAGSGTKMEAKRNIVASIEFAVRASLTEERCGGHECIRFPQVHKQPRNQSYKPDTCNHGGRCTSSGLVRLAHIG